MDMPKKGPMPPSAVDRALIHLKQAEVELLATIRPGNDPNHAALLEVHAFLWEAISALVTISGKKPHA